MSTSTSCPFCLLKKYSAIPVRFNNLDARLCKTHAKKHPPHWCARREAWLVVVRSGPMSVHCHVPNPLTGRWKDPTTELES